MNEFKHTDNQELNKPKAEGFKNIKPENGMTKDKAKEKFENRFDSKDSDNENIKNIDGHTHYYDDNGNEYRVDNELKPNSKYEINGYKYQTDNEGRIISAEGKLHLKTRTEKLSIKDNIHDIGKGDEKKTDDRGHLIGDRFDGSNGMENMVVQDAKINRVDYNKFEGELAKQIEGGKDVRVNIKPVYDGDSGRPTEIVVIYSIDGVKSQRTFQNKSD